MNVSLPLHRMTAAEKLELVERVWEDLCRDEAQLPSPAWHEVVLRDREAALRDGRERPMDWEAAKAKLRSLRG